MTTRRKFLNWLGLGMFASAATVLRPARLWAGWRSRGGSCPPPCAEAYLPMYGMPVGLPIQQGVRRKRITYGADVTPSYPPAGGGTIPGGGDFCCWGVTGSQGIFVNGILFTDRNSNPLTQPGSWTEITGDLDGDWGFAVADYGSQSNFYIVYRYMKPNGMGGMMQTQTNPVGPYST